MKKFIAIAAMTLLLPFTAFGLTVMQDDQMNNITAQAGVTIAADVSLDLTADTIAWGDEDGLNDGTSTAGWIGLKNLDANGVRYHLRTDMALTALADLQPLTIDVATDAAKYDGNTFVQIGLGTFQLDVASLHTEIELGADNTLGQELSTLDITNMTILGGSDSYVDITTHGTSGVTLAFDVNLDSITMDALAWGDSDGLETGTVIAGLTDGGDYTTAGYHGLRDVKMTTVTVDGLLNIDTATMDKDAAGALATSTAIADAGAAIGAYQGLAAAASYETKLIAAHLAAGGAPTDPQVLALEAMGGNVTDAVALATAGGTALAASNIGINILYAWDGDTNSAGGTNNVSDTLVLLDFQSLNVGIGTFSADSVVANNAQLAGADTLGSIYMSNVNVTATGWVAVGAH